MISPLIDFTRRPRREPITFEDATTHHRAHLARKTSIINARAPFASAHIVCYCPWYDGMKPVCIVFWTRAHAPLLLCVLGSSVPGDASLRSKRVYAGDDGLWSVTRHQSASLVSAVVRFSGGDRQQPLWCTCLLGFHAVYGTQGTIIFIVRRVRNPFGYRRTPPTTHTETRIISFQLRGGVAELARVTVARHRNDRKANSTHTHTHQVLCWCFAIVCTIVVKCLPENMFLNPRSLYMGPANRSANDSKMVVCVCAVYHSTIEP